MNIKDFLLYIVNRLDGSLIVVGCCRMLVPINRFVWSADVVGCKYLTLVLCFCVCFCCRELKSLILVYSETIRRVFADDSLNHCKVHPNILRCIQQCIILSFLAARRVWHTTWFTSRPGWFSFLANTPSCG